MKSKAPFITEAIGKIPYRLQLAGGWIDQPFVSRLNPKPPGAMVVVQIEPTFRPMDRSGIAGGTRAVAMQLWKGRLPDRPPDQLARELYAAENRGRAEPSGSQDMIGLIYPGVNRLDYDFKIHDGVFPSHIESLNSARHARWLEKTLHLLPVEPRPEGYSPLGMKNLEPEWISRLGRSGRDCFNAIKKMDVDALGASFNETMLCWEKILPRVLAHPLIKLDLKAILKVYQGNFPGAMFSGCGGGYLLVASKEKVPGSLQVTVRVTAK
ncbi:MAG: hypothetical protein ABR955_04485 [Verrucomicrobiota bacterium]|jgi:hypothetical protein